MRISLLSFCILLVSSLTCSANDFQSAKSEKTISVFVSIMPEVYFVQRIGGNRVNVHALVQPGQSPATYAPTPKQMALLAQADIYFKIGVPFENSLLPKIKRSLPLLSIRDLNENIDLLNLEEHTHDDHQNSHSIENESELDPHTWLDPQLVRHHASIITNALTQIDPDFAQQYIANFQKFSTELEQLDQTLKQLLQPFSGQSIYVFHPAFGYFCKAYNLVQKAVAVDGKEPGARHLARLIETARNDKIQAIFVQPQFSSKTASAIAEAIGAKIVPIDPLAPNYISNMMHIAQEIIQSQISSTN